MKIVHSSAVSRSEIARAERPQGCIRSALAVIRNAFSGPSRVKDHPAMSFVDPKHSNPHVLMVASRVNEGFKASRR